MSASAARTGSGPTAPPVVAVVGAGIAGLSAAWELCGGSADRSDDGRAPEVVVLEAQGRPGGKLRSTDFDGRRVDLAADAFLARRPEATGLCEELGLGDELVAPGESGASVLARGRLRPLPAGLHLGIPTRLGPLVGSGMFSPAELARAALDIVVPRIRAHPVLGDASVGTLVGERLGRAVVDRLVGPLLGGINAGDPDQLSAAATVPVLLAAASQSGSLMHRLGQAGARAAARPSELGATQHADGPPPPVFWSLRSSTASLVDALDGALAGRGVTRHLNSAVERLERVGDRWRLHLAPGSEAGDHVDADGVVVAVPAAPAATLLRPHAPAAADLLDGVEYASVTVVTLGISGAHPATPLTGTGFLVPRSEAVGGRPALVTGCTYLSRKWPHLHRDGELLVRASTGRAGDARPDQLDDDELVTAVSAELAEILGTGPLAPDALVTRWANALPQYRPGHLLRVARIEEAVAQIPAVAVAGAAYRGVGVPACVGSGRAAARRVRAAVASRPEPVER